MGCMEDISRQNVRLGSGRKVSYGNMAEQHGGKFLMFGSIQLYRYGRMVITGRYKRSDMLKY